LLLETAVVSTNYIYSGSRTYPGPRPQYVSVAWKRTPAARLIQEEGLMYALYDSSIGSQLSPRSPGGPQVRPVI